MAERRRSVRGVARIEVYDPDRRSDRVPLYISMNVSGGGMFLITQDPFPPQTKLRISFNLPNDPDPIEATGEVVWRRTEREAPERQPGMGIRFVEIDQGDRERIRSFVRRQSGE